MPPQANTRFHTRIQRASPKMNFMFDGWVRPVTALKGESGQRLRPSERVHYPREQHR
jgi:hypothetical protein